MVDDIYSIFAEVYEGDELRTKAMNAVIFILFHEIGHALIDIYDLSVTGLEEDVVDNFSIFLLTTGNELAESAAIDGANFFNVMAQAEEGMPVGMLPLWDEHSLSKERFFNIITKVYGKDPKRYEYFVTNGLFPADKTQRYVQDYQKVMESWRRDLDPYLKK
jgi:Putative metallopeptidase